MQIIGILGSLCFAFCLFPQVVTTYKKKDASGLSWAFLWLSLMGNVASCGYVLYTNYISGVWQYPLYFNYGVALVLCVLLMVAKVRFRGLEYARKTFENCERAKVIAEKAGFLLEMDKLQAAIDKLLKDRIHLLDENILMKKYFNEVGVNIQEILNKKN